MLACDVSVSTTYDTRAHPCSLPRANLQNMSSAKCDTHRCERRSICMDICFRMRTARLPVASTTNFLVRPPSKPLANRRSRNSTKDAAPRWNPEPRIPEVGQPSPTSTKQRQIRLSSCHIGAYLQRSRARDPGAPRSTDRGARKLPACVGWTGLERPLYGLRSILPSC